MRGVCLTGEIGLKQDDFVALVYILLSLAMMSTISSSRKGSKFSRGLLDICLTGPRTSGTAGKCIIFLQDKDQLMQTSSLLFSAFVFRLCWRDCTLRRSFCCELLYYTKSIIL